MIFTPKMTKWLGKNVPGKTYSGIAPIFNKRFDVEYTPLQIKSHCNYCGIKAGHRRPIDRVLEVGTERIISKKAGVTYIKISAKPVKGCCSITGWDGAWKQKHYLIWEAENGPVPKNHVVIFADGDRSNFDIDNLLLVSRRVLLYMNSNGLFSHDPDIIKTNLLIVMHRLLILDKVSKLTDKNKYISVVKRFRRIQKCHSKKQPVYGTNE